MRKISFSIQHYGMDCGPTCLRIIAKHYDKSISLETIRNYSGFSKEGVSLLGIAEAAEKIGLTLTELHSHISN